jgi:hypothetical protein
MVGCLGKSRGCRGVYLVDGDDRRAWL